MATNDDDDYHDYHANYYNIAHANQETVTEQASIMVYGKLKEYQVSWRKYGRRLHMKALFTLPIAITVFALILVTLNW